MEMTIIAAIIVAIPATFAASAAWYATLKNKKMLVTNNGTTTAQYTEQTFELLKSVSHRQDEMSRQVENHIVNERVHYASG